MDKKENPPTLLQAVIILLIIALCALGDKLAQILESIW